MKIFLLTTVAIIILSFFILIVSSTIISDGKQGRPGLNEVSGEVELNHNEFIQISGKDIFGKEISEQDFSEEIIMIDFWASWCPPCIQEAEVLSDASKYWKDKNVRFIGLALWDNENSVKKFVEKHDFKYDITLDKDGKYRDLTSHVEDLNPNSLNFETFSKIKSLDLLSLSEIPKSERIGSCISRPGKFIAIGLNFSDHAAETGAKPPTEPIMFMKATSSICGPNDNIEIVSGSKKLDWEVELGVIIGKDAKHISERESQDHILGYCLVNDVSEREWQIEKMGQWVKGKSHDTFGPVGPYLVTKDEIKDINNLNMSLNLNGNRMQTGNTNTMIFNVDVIVSYVSKFMSLQAGDIITTGTPPGVGMGMKPQKFLKKGDELKLKIDNLGEQNSKVVAI